MRCPSCNSENPETTKFCGSCGAPLEAVCANCGAENPPQFKFCGECGTPLRKPRRSPEPARPRGSPLAQKILREKSGAGAEPADGETMALGVRASAEAATNPSSGAPDSRDPDALDAEVARILKENRYDRVSDTLPFTQAQAESFQAQQGVWRDYFTAPDRNGGLAAGLIQDPGQLRELTAFFAWAAWASAAAKSLERSLASNSSSKR